jgi:rhodanese-related sulfurtransferase
MNIQTLLCEHNGVIIDVRTRSEFSSGSAVNAINIPIQELPLRIEEIKSFQKPVIVCCASGNRSGQASRFLNQIGIKCYDGESWTSINHLQSLKEEVE